MSRYRLSQKSGISQSSISNLLNRKSLPTLITLDKICTGFEITLSQFFSQDDSIVDLTDEQKHLLSGSKSLQNLMDSEIK